MKYNKREVIIEATAWAIIVVILFVIVKIIKYIL
jgi:hypothetical protein